MKTCLGGPTPGEFDAMVAERDSLKRQLEDAQATVTELKAKVLNSCQCMPRINL
jgi:hypothetical protein